MSRAYAVLAWCAVALGLVHIAAATRIYPALTSTALWFVSGGIVLILAGALNLLNRTYGRPAPGVRYVCLATNIGMTAFTLVSGLVGHASTVSLVLVVGAFAGLSILSVQPGAWIGRPVTPTPP